jgi:AraC family transcriptional activator of pobA
LAISPGHLSALCTQFAGTGAKALLERALASRARRMLLYTDETVDRIGASLGFKDPSYFTRFFRRETGETPSGFRGKAVGG